MTEGGDPGELIEARVNSLKITWDEHANAGYLYFVENHDSETVNPVGNGLAVDRDKDGKVLGIEFLFKDILPESLRQSIDDGGGGESSSSLGDETDEQGPLRTETNSAEPRDGGEASDNPTFSGSSSRCGEPPKTPWDDSRKVVVLNKKLQLAKSKLELAAISSDWSKAEEARDLLDEMIEVEPKP